MELNTKLAKERSSWTPPEERQLIERYETFLLNSSQEHQRTVSAIVSKLRKLHCRGFSTGQEEQNV